MGEFTSLLYTLLGGGVVAMVTAGVAAIRKYKSGEIVDDDAIIARLNSDNINIRHERDEARNEAARERMQKFAWQEQAIRYRHQLVVNEYTPSDQDVWKEYGAE